MAAGAVRGAGTVRAVIGVTSDSVMRVDALTLKPLGRSLPLPDHWGAIALSPDRQILAVAANDSGLVRLIDVKRMRRIGDMHAIGSPADHLVWIAPRLVVVGAPTATGEELVALDAGTRRARWQSDVNGQLLQIKRFGNGLVLLTAPEGQIGPAQLIEVSATGQVRSFALDSTLAGEYLPDDPSAPGGEIRWPGMAVDARDGHAYVVGTGEPVADVDLSSLQVVYHGGNRTLAKSLTGWSLQATWLGQGLIAVAGVDFSTVVGADGSESEELDPAGLTFVNTSDWSFETVDSSAAGVVRSGAALLASGFVHVSSNVQKGDGVSLFGFDGALHRHLFGDQLVFSMAVVHGLGYVELPESQGMAVIDPVSGHVLAERPSKLLQIL